MKKAINIILIFILWFTLIWCWDNINDDNVLIDDNKIENNVIPKDEGVFSDSKQEIIKLQLEHDRDYVINLNCDEYDNDWKQYCENEKSELNKIANEVSWGIIQAKWHEYIIKFDCNDLNNETNIQLCNDYKKNYTSTWAYILDTTWAWAIINNFSSLSWIEFKNYDCNSINNDIQIELCQRRQSNHNKVEEYFINMSNEEIKLFDCEKLKEDKLNVTCEIYKKNINPN